VYTCSYLVGEKGKVIGVDMTEAQLDKARKHVDYHTNKFGYKHKNIEFHQGLIENLSMIPDNSVDVVISNCVVNLSPSKAAVFKEIYRVLKLGGELYFSDVYSDRRIPEHLQADKVLWGECLTGALYFEDFRRIMQKTGFEDVRVMSSAPISIKNNEIEKKSRKNKFLFKNC